MSLLRLWFGFDPVGPRAYAASGFALFAFKYLADVLIVRALTGKLWAPWSYLNPSWSVRMEPLDLGRGNTAMWLFIALASWSLPFVWIGFSMTLRRLYDAGVSRGFSVLFFVPVVNYLMMLILCFVPTRREEWVADLVEVPQPSDTPPRAERDAAEREGMETPVVFMETERRPPLMRDMAIAIAAGSLIGVAMVVVATLGFRSYGVAIFIGCPFVLGFVTASVLNLRQRTTFMATMAAVVLAIGFVAGMLMLFALEGLACIFMAAPIAIPFAVVGGAFAFGLIGSAASLTRRMAGASAVLPLMLIVESTAPQPVLREVVTSVEIEAPPEVVWANVIGFTELPAPHDLVFRLGIAYPTRARLDGEGVGAVRHCEFSTGAFVEPITHWEPPRRLAFDVTEQPPPLQEWSPYAHVHAPHLTGETLRSRRGEFLLERLPGGNTRLRGTTWYELDMAPGFYWRLWSDALIHRIHRRVLDHVKALSEAAVDHPCPPVDTLRKCSTRTAT